MVEAGEIRELPVVLRLEFQDFVFLAEVYHHVVTGFVQDDGVFAVGGFRAFENGAGAAHVFDRLGMEGGG